MSVENFIVRLYYPYDADLIALMEMDGFSLPYVTKQALTYYSKGKKLVIDTPKAKRFIPKSNKHLAYSYHFYLDTEKDMEAINFLNTIKPGLRCSFLKALVKASVDYAHLEYFIDETEKYPKDVFEFMNDVHESGMVFKCPVQKKTLKAGLLNNCYAEELPENSISVDSDMENYFNTKSQEEYEEEMRDGEEKPAFVFKSLAERNRETEEKQRKARDILREYRENDNKL
jgi:hypothetical protein